MQKIYKVCTKEPQQNAMKLQELQYKNEKDKSKKKLVYLFLVGLVGFDALQLSMMIKQ
jgi:hypothetical protein